MSEAREIRKVPYVLEMTVSGFTRTFDIPNENLRRIIRFGSAPAASDCDITLVSDVTHPVDGLHVELHPIASALKPAVAGEPVAEDKYDPTPLYLVVVRGRWPVCKLPCPVDKSRQRAAVDDDTADLIWPEIVSPLATTTLALGDSIEIGTYRVTLKHPANQEPPPAPKPVETDPVKLLAPVTPRVDGDAEGIDKLIKAVDLCESWLWCEAVMPRLLETDQPSECLVTVRSLSETHDLTFFVSAHLDGIDESCSRESIHIPHQPRMLNPGGADSDQIRIEVRHLRRPCQPAGERNLQIAIECLRDNAPTGRMTVPIVIEPFENLDIRIQ